MMRFCAKEFAPRIGHVHLKDIRKNKMERTVSDEQLEQDKERYPLKRYGKPEDIAYACVYLLSDASSWMTGQDLVLDGGVSIK